MFDAFGAALAAALVVAGPLAVGVTKIVDFIRNLFGELPSWLINVIATVIGIAVCLGWGVNVFGGLVSAVPALAESDVLKGVGGTVLTGVLVAGMASFWHDKMAQWAATRKAP